MKENLSNRIEYLRYLLRWDFLPAIILFGGIYVAIEGRHTELGFYLSLVGVFSLALWANHNRPKSYSDYLKNVEQEKTEMEELEKIKKKYFDEQTFKMNKMTTDDLISFITENRDLLSQKGNSLGVWFDTENNQFYLDENIGGSDIPEKPMSKIPLHNIFERVFKIKDISSEKELADLVLQLKYDPLYRKQIDELLAKLSDSENYKKK